MNNRNVEVEGGRGHKDTKLPKYREGGGGVILSYQLQSQLSVKHQADFLQQISDKIRTLQGSVVA